MSPPSDDPPDPPIGAEPEREVSDVAAAARQQDPGLPAETAGPLAGHAVELLAEVGPDAPEIARRLLAAHPDVGASQVNAVATATTRHAGAGPAPS